MHYCELTHASEVLLAKYFKWSKKHVVTEKQKPQRVIKYWSDEMQNPVPNHLWSLKSPGAYCTIRMPISPNWNVFNTQVACHLSFIPPMFSLERTSSPPALRCRAAFCNPAMLDHSGGCSSNACKCLVGKHTHMDLGMLSWLQPIKMSETNGISWMYLIVKCDP